MTLTGKSITGQGQDILANYDFVDFADGTGIVVFHGGSVKTNSGAYEFRLSRNVFYSDIISSGAFNNVTGDAKVADFNFDVTFNQPRIVKGNSLVCLPIGIEGATGPSTFGAYGAIAVQKVSGGVQTEIFALTSGSLLSTAISYQTKYSTIPADLPQTNFKRGDTLRLQVQVYERSNGVTNGIAMLGMDPKNRTESGSYKWQSGDSDLQFHVPFKLDI